jgi:hypothetical protein
MIKRFTGTLALALLLAGSNAQVKWPAITQTAKPWTRWWWEGSAVNKMDLAAVMKQYQQAGLGGLELTPIYGVKGHEKEFINFLSPQWMDMFQYTLQQGKQLGLGIDMATGTGWPFGGPWVTPADACKNINLLTWSLKGGEQLKEPVKFIQQPLVRTENGKQADIKTLSYPVASNKDMQGYAFDQVRYEMPLPLELLMAYSDKGDKIDLTAKVEADGKLNCTVPEGNWNLYALFMGWHGKNVERAAPGGEGDAIDHFSAKALKDYLSQFDNAFAGKDISYLRSFFNDSYEVDDARGQSNWTPDFLKEFLQRRGYDLRNELPALYQKDTPEKNTRVLYDYRQTISELILEKFTRPWHDWARTKGKLIRNQSHGSPANILDLYAAIDIPETEGTDILRFKFATSAAHVMGKPLASSESATWLNEHFLSSWGDVKKAIDKYFIGGVNHIFYHGLAYSPQDAPWPGWLFYAAVHFQPTNPMWKDFGTLNNYVARCQSFLQSGKADNDVLLYFPFSDRIAEPGKEMLHHFDGMEGFKNTAFEQSAQSMLNHGYAFDLISDKQVRQLRTSGKQLQTGGVRYKTIVLADTKYVPLETLEKLVQLVREGATVIMYKNLPSDVPGLGELARRQAAFKNLLLQLSFAESSDGVKKAVLGSGAVLLGDDLDALLTAAMVKREDMVDKGLQYARRQYNNGSYYFIANTGSGVVRDWVPLRNGTATVILFDPMLERSGLAKTKKETDGRTAVYLDLQPGESCILQTSNIPANGSRFPYTTVAGDTRPIKGNWQLSFIKGGPELPAAASLGTLGSWTDLPGDAVKNFSGTGKYTISFKKPLGSQSAWLLDLGEVRETAEIILNGKKLATLIGPSYRVVIPASRLKQDNELEIIVSNLMANRIAYMDRNNLPWKIFYNTNMPARLAQNRGADGLFTTAGWLPNPSGLLGPVMLTPVAYVNKF